MAVYALEVDGAARGLQDGWTIQKNGNSLKRCDFSIVSLDGTGRPSLGDEVYLTKDGARIFGGLIDRPVEAGLFKGGATATYPNPLIFRLSASDFNVYANRIHLTADIPAGNFKAFLTVVATALAAQGVTLHGSQANGPALPALSYVDKPIIDVLNEGASLASGTGSTSWVWNIDYDKKLRAIETGTDPAPFDITDVDDGNVLGDIEVEQQRSSDFANYIIVLGGTGQRDVTDTFTGDGVTTEFDLNYQFLSGWVVVVDGIFETLGTAPAQWIVDPVANTITRGTAPSLGADISITYIAQFPKRVIADSGVPAAERVMRTYTAPDVFDLTILEALAESYLERDSQDPKTVRYNSALDETDFDPGQTQAITKANRDLSGTFLITAVTIRSVAAKYAQSQVTAVSTRRLPRTLREATRQFLSGSDAAAGTVAVGGTTGSVGGTGTAGELVRWATASVLSDAGGVATADIDDDAVTFAKMQNIASGSVLGRTTAGSGNVEEITGRLFRTGTGHPQGVVSAAIGTYYVDTNTGYVFVKRGGAATEYGWYLLPHPGPAMGGSLFWYAWQVGASASIGDAGRFGVNSPLAINATNNGQTYIAGIPRVHFFETSTSSGNSAFLNESGGTVVRWWEEDFDYLTVGRTPADITNLRIWLGLARNSPSDSDTYASIVPSAIFMAYRTTIPDPGWVGFTQNNGGSSSVTAQVAAIAADTVYRVRIRLVRSGTPKVYFSVNDGTEVEQTGTIPATAETSYVMHAITTKTAAARRWNWISTHLLLGAQA